MVKGREVYFALYQAISGDDVRPALYREYPPEALARLTSSMATQCAR